MNENSILRGSRARKLERVASRKAKAWTKNVATTHACRTQRVSRRARRSPVAGLVRYGCSSSKMSRPRASSWRPSWSARVSSFVRLRMEKRPLSRYRASQADVIVLDLMLPVVSGFAVARALRPLARRRNVAILAVTALASEALRIEALAAGCDGFLRKPIPPTIVVEQVRLLVDRLPSTLPSGGQR